MKHDVTEVRRTDHEITISLGALLKKAGIVCPSNARYSVGNFVAHSFEEVVVRWSEKESE